MAERPILFSTDMVKAILEGRKTMTRRIIKSRHECGLFRVCKNVFGEITSIDSLDWDERPLEMTNDIHCHYGKIGDILWVKETLYQNGELGLEYFADKEMIDEGIIPGDFKVRLDKNNHYKFCKIPSLYMPKWACRIRLEITDIKAERLQDITPHDACEEGINYWNIDADAFEGGELQADFENYTWTEKKEKDPNYEDRYSPTFASCIDSFRTLWQSINGQESWQANPWVWAITFKKL